MTETTRPNPSDIASLSIAWEQAAPAPGCPIAVEITFTPAKTGNVQVRRLPLNIGIAIDRSGSMAGGKLGAATLAASRLADSLADGERFAAAAFDHNVVDVSASVRLDENSRSRIRTSLAQLQAGGTTALFDGFARTAELVAMGGDSATCDSCVIVLSDGMGNQGLTEPKQMHGHAAALAERGIRTITVGIGADYQASQLTALADGGNGEFHHATLPDEIVEIVLGELNALRVVAARDLRLQLLPAGANRCLFLGGDTRSSRNEFETLFDRISSGRVARAVLLFWPGDSAPTVSVRASWSNADSTLGSASVPESSAADGERNTALALRAAQLWQAVIIAHALELNERELYDDVASYMQSARAEFTSYVQGLPEREVDELLSALEQVGNRASTHWGTIAQRESYSYASKMIRGKGDLRSRAPASFSETMALDD